jgi:hypothetical protein
MDPGVESVSNINAYQISYRGRGRPVCKAGNLTAISEPTVYKTWEPRRLTNPTGRHGLLQGQSIPFFYLFKAASHSKYIRRKNHNKKIGRKLSF